MKHLLKRCEPAPLFDAAQRVMQVHGPLSYLSIIFFKTPQSACNRDSVP